jgi:hypothetical protein
VRFLGGFAAVGRFTGETAAFPLAPKTGKAVLLVSNPMRVSAAAALAALAAVVAPVALAASVAPADRAAINRTLDAFVPTAVARSHSERAWTLATRAMHAGGTRAGWVRGELPVAPFPAAGRTFHGWTVDAVRPGAVDLVLLLHPRKGANAGPISFDVTMRKVGGRWLVDSFVPAAVFAAPGEDSAIQAAPDFAPGPAAPPFSKSGRIGEDWALIVPAVLAGLIVFVPLLVLIMHRRRDRRAVRQYSSARGRV